MNITIEINTVNAEFEYDAGLEVARILEGLAKQLQSWNGEVGFRLNLSDINGNVVGEARTDV